jgi:hypothetical protein
VFAGEVRACGTVWRLVLQRGRERSHVDRSQVRRAHGYALSSTKLLLILLLRAIVDLFRCAWTRVRVCTCVCVRARVSFVRLHVRLRGRVGVAWGWAGKHVWHCGRTQYVRPPLTHALLNVCVMRTALRWHHCHCVSQVEPHTLHLRWPASSPTHSHVASHSFTALHVCLSAGHRRRPVASASWRNESRSSLRTQRRSSSRK